MRRRDLRKKGRGKGGRGQPGVGSSSGRSCGDRGPVGGRDRRPPLPTSASGFQFPPLGRPGPGETRVPRRGGGGQRRRDREPARGPTHWKSPYPLHLHQGRGFGTRGQPSEAAPP